MQQGRSFFILRGLPLVSMLVSQVYTLHAFTGYLSMSDSYVMISLLNVQENHDTILQKAHLIMLEIQDNKIHYSWKILIGTIISLCHIIVVACYAINSRLVRPNSMNFTILSKVAKLHSKHIFILWGKSTHHVIDMHCNFSCHGGICSVCRSLTSLSTNDCRLFLPVH